MAASLTVETGTAATWSAEPFLPWYMLAGLIVGAGIWLRFSYRRDWLQIPFERAACLLLLRIAALCIVLIGLVRPVKVHSTQYREKSLLVVGLDQSSSMNLKDTPFNLTRWGFSLRLFSDHDEDWRQLNEKFDVRRVVFDSQIHEVAKFPGELATQEVTQPEGRATNLSAMIERISTESGGSVALADSKRTRSGVLGVIITDGRSNAGGDPVQASRSLKHSGTPIFVVGVGNESQPRDFKEILVKSIEVPERAYAGSQAILRVEIESHLPKDLEVPLTLSVDGGKVDERNVLLQAGDQIQRLEIPYTPSEVGIHKAVATLPSLSGEVNTMNNIRSAFVRVYRGRLGVWYVEGTIRKEFGSLRTALEASPNINFMALNAFTRRSAAERDLLPTTEEMWKEVKLVVIGDIPASRFSVEQLSRLSQFVANGGSLLMLGGLEALGSGGWGGSELSAALPAAFGGTEGAAEGPLPLEITAEGVSHPAVRLASDPARSMDIWRGLPTPGYINKVGEMRMKSKVLVRAGPYPLVAVQEFGRGRSAIFTGDASWLWIVKAGQAEIHRTFWRNLSTWLMHSDYRDADKILYVDTDRLQYLLGDTVEMTAHLQETEALAAKLRNAKIMASLECAGGPSQNWEMGTGMGDYSSKNNPQRAGLYTFKVEVQVPTEPGRPPEVLAKDSINFHVEEPDLENENPRANLTQLQRMSLETGGEYYDMSSAGSVFKSLIRQPSGFSKTVKDSEDAWNHWSLLALFIAALTGEWALRRRWGLA